MQDKSGRYVMVVGSVGGTEISILNVYAPNEYDPGFFKEIANIISDNSKGMLVIGGDFNGSEPDRTSPPKMLWAGLSSSGIQAR